MEIFVTEHDYSWLKKVLITNKALKVVKLSGKYDILSVQQKQQVHIENKTKRIPEMTPGKRYIEAHNLKLAKMRTNKLIKKER